MKRVAIYSRKSVWTDRGESTKVQIEMCKEYFSKKGEYCFEVFEDEGFSGGNTNRPDFQRMMNRIKEKKIDIVVCYKIDRIARNIIDFFDTYNILEKQGVKLISITEGFDASTPIGKLVMIILAGFAEMERMNTKERVTDNMLALARSGKWTGGTPPIGYKPIRVSDGLKEFSILELDEETQNIVTDTYKLFLEGLSTRKIAKSINKKYKIKTSQKRICNILYSPTYVGSSQLMNKYLESLGFLVYGKPSGKGYLTYQKTTTTPEGSKILDNTNPTMAITSMHEPIVKEKIWIETQERLKQITVEPKPRKSQFTFLSHMVKCGYCNAPMQVYSDTRKEGVQRYFRKTCTCDHAGKNFRGTRLTIEKAEKEVYKFLSKITDIEALNEYLSNDTENNESSKEIYTQEKELKRLDKLIDGLTEKIALASVNTVDVLLKKLDELVHQKENVKIEIMKLEMKNAIKLNEQENKNIICNTSKEFIALYADLDIEEKRKYVQNIIKFLYWKGQQRNLAVELIDF